MACPLGDNTSTEVDVDPTVDLVTTLFEEENVGEGPLSSKKRMWEKGTSPDLVYPHPSLYADPYSCLCGTFYA
jgi:hypothetical protein